jgi:hypothetical protein
MTPFPEKERGQTYTVPAEGEMVLVTNLRNLAKAAKAIERYYMSDGADITFAEIAKWSEEAAAELTRLSSALTSKAQDYEELVFNYGDCKRRAFALRKALEGLLANGVDFTHDCWNVARRMLDEPDDGSLTSKEEEIGELRRALAFARSCIKSGEPWTDRCEEVIGRALAVTEQSISDKH